VITVLLKNRHDPDIKDTWGRTPLSCGAENGHEAVVKQVLDKGAELESKDRDGRTPLRWAAAYGHEAVVKLLLEKGPDDPK
jgi:ankyrin repeat protein